MKEKIFWASLFIFALVVAFPCIGVSAAKKPLLATDSNSPIQIDGYFDDWAGKPYSWEYNWNNPLPYGESDYTTVDRHKMSLYRDGNNVYLHIIMAKNYYNSLIGDDYEFYCDGQRTIFRVANSDGSEITNSSFGPGIHKVTVFHGDSALSGKPVSGGKAMLFRKPGGTNDELELEIPLKAFSEQRHSINSDNIKDLQFFTPNLMYRHIACAGTGTAPYIGIAVCIGSVAAGYLIIRKVKTE